MPGPKDSTGYKAYQPEVKVMQHCFPNICGLLQQLRLTLMDFEMACKILGQHPEWFSLNLPKLQD